jgi:hypothetical protein
MALTAKEHDRLATRYLVRAAFYAKAISCEDYEFLLDSPERWPEVSEFLCWLSGA